MLLDTRNHPLLVHDDTGKAAVTLVCALIRCFQRWALAAVYAEGDMFAGAGGSEGGGVGNAGREVRFQPGSADTSSLPCLTPQMSSSTSCTPRRGLWRGADPLFCLPRGVTALGAGLRGRARRRGEGDTSAAHRGPSVPPHTPRTDRYMARRVTPRAQAVGWLQVLHCSHAIWHI